FVQPRYWGKRSLDYLWYGIGAYIKANPQIKYMFGPVTLSDSYPHEAKELIAAFYLQQFGQQTKLAVGRRRFEIRDEVTSFIAEELAGDYKESYKKLKLLLEEYGVKVPTLFKQYSELCEEDGCQFIDFSLDPDFNNCTDCLILVDVAKIKAKKYNRYIG
ncbi:MAG TPA: GNAT family N-acetyltransferase, partial [Thiomicrospira sp.]|nr:GNAT family N-acetyltransferase [Thiomicrospira sp.]